MMGREIVDVSSEKRMKQTSINCGKNAVTIWWCR